MNRLYVKQKTASVNNAVAAMTGSEISSRLPFINSAIMRSQVWSWLGRYFSRKSDAAVEEPAVKENKPVFVFQGRNGNYTNMGRALYKKSTVFRNSIKKCHQVCSEKFHFDLLRVFEDENYDLQTAPELEVFVALSCIQCALTDFYTSNGVTPEAIVAMSLGEAAAGYAAGAYALEDAVSIAFYIFDTCAHMAEQCTLFTVYLTAAELEDIITESEGTLIHFAEFTLTKRVLICSNKHLDAVLKVLHRNKIYSKQLEYHGAYHTPYSIDAINREKNSILSKFGSVRYLPLKTKFYTCLYERPFSEGSRLNAMFWVNMLTSPVLFGRVVTSIIQNGSDIFLNIGGHPKLSADIQMCAADINKQVAILDSFSRNEPELPLINKTMEQLSLLCVNQNFVPSLHIPDKTHDPSAFMSADFFQDPYPYYEKMRKDQPVRFLQEHNYWLVLNYADVEFALKNPDIFSSAPAKGLDAVLLGAAPPDHGRARRLIAPFFKNTAVASLTSFIQATAEDLIGKNRHHDFDIVKDYAIPLTEKVIFQLIGFGSEDIDRLQRTIGSNKYDLSCIPVLEQLFSEYVKNYVNTGDGSLCACLLNNGREEGFAPDELVSILKLLWVAGTTTTSMLISSSLLIMLSQPDIEHEIQSDLSRIPVFIEEVLRYESPEQTSWRTTMSDIRLSGVTIPANSEVRLCLAAANRDPLVFDSPSTFSLDRHARKHLAYAAGPHYCLGAELARLEARIAVETICRVLPALQIKTSRNELQYLHSDHFRALTQLTAGTG